MCGPAFVASIAYVDPGNFVTNTQAGANYGYLLIWCVFGASLLAMPVQYLSARLGVVSGKSLAAVCRSELPRCASLILWAQAEIVAMCTDLAEFVGAALGLNLLFDVPLPVAGGMTAIIAFIILRVQRDGSRKLELATAVCLALVGSGFGYQLLHLKPSLQATLGGLVPHLAGHGSVLLAVGIVGATVMPHAIYLHSSLTSEHAVRMAPYGRRRFLTYQRLDVVLALGAAGLVNMAMLATAAKLFNHSPWQHLDSLATAHQGLLHLAGGTTAVVFAASLFASGASSSAVGTYAGQAIMAGFLNRTISLTLRRALTMAPAVTILIAGVNPTAALLGSQVVLALGIPFALIPLIWFTSRPKLMGEHVNSAFLTLAATAVAAVIIGLDATLIYQQLR